MARIEMVLKFFTDPQTGVIVPPVTVFNGGKRNKKTRKTNKTKQRKTRTRKQTLSSRKRKTMRR